MTLDELKRRARAAADSNPDVGAFLRALELEAEGARRVAALEEERIVHMVALEMIDQGWPVHA